MCTHTMVLMQLKLGIPSKDDIMVHLAVLWPHLHYRILDVTESMMAVSHLLKQSLSSPLLCCSHVHYMI